MLICSHSPTNQSCCLKSCQEKHQFPPCCNFPSEELLREALHSKQLGLGRRFREHDLPRCSAERPVLGNLLSSVPARTPNVSRVWQTLGSEPWICLLGPSLSTYRRIKYKWLKILAFCGWINWHHLYGWTVLHGINTWYYVLVFSSHWYPQMTCNLLNVVWDFCFCALKLLNFRVKNKK